MQIDDLRTAHVLQRRLNGLLQNLEFAARKSHPHKAVLWHASRQFNRFDHGLRSDVEDSHVPIVGHRCDKNVTFAGGACLLSLKLFLLHVAVETATALNFKL